MKRLYTTLVLIIATLVIASCSTSEDVVPSGEPNILLIIADDMGQDMTPGYDIGTVKPVMPHLQGFIDEGIRFTNFWSNPTCTPTRSSILTGKYGFRFDVTKVGDNLATSETALQTYLTENTSYSNAVIGKWHVSNDADHPADMGVDYYAGLLSGAVQSYSNWNFTEQGQTSNSQSFQGLLTDANSETRDFVYSEIGHTAGGSDYTLRNQTHKYIRFDDGSEALYNLSENPLESPNLLNPNQLPLSASDEAVKDELVQQLAIIRQ